MSTKVEEYTNVLSDKRNHRSYLLNHSGLPGPRGNIELARAFAQTASQKLINDYSLITADEAPVNTPDEFLAFCGVLGLGRLAVEGKKSAIKKLRRAASDERWRVREAVAMALQTIGKNNMDALIRIARKWGDGNYYEQRAAAAGLCEPVLLQDEAYAQPLFDILTRATASIENAGDRSSEGFKALRKGLAYCWSVAVAAYPDTGKPAVERWISNENPDVQWIMKQNLKKKRLQRMDPGWVERMIKKM